MALGWVVMGSVFRHKFIINWIDNPSSIYHGPHYIDEIKSTKANFARSLQQDRICWELVAVAGVRMV